MDILDIDSESETCCNDVEILEDYPPSLEDYLPSYIPDNIINETSDSDVEILEDGLLPHIPDTASISDDDNVINVSSDDELSSPPLKKQTVVKLMKCESPSSSNQHQLVLISCYIVRLLVIILFRCYLNGNQNIPIHNNGCNLVRLGCNHHHHLQQFITT